MKFYSPNATRRNRRGAVLIAVLVCMGFATVVLLGIVQNSLHQRRQMRRNLQMEQTQWLLDAGLSTGIARLMENSDYEGETISVTPQMEKYTRGSIEITVIREDAPEQKIRLRVRARLENANESLPEIQRSKEIVIDEPEK